MRCFIVLGVPRSGTSAVSGVLHHLGVMMGERFLPPSPMNPRGFFEDEEVVELHNPFLDLGKFPESVILDDDQSRLQGYERFIRKRESLGRPWGFKSSLTPFVFHIAKKFITQPLAVIATHRPFHECVHSWAKQRQCSIREAKQIIGNSLYARDLALSEFSGEVLHIEYSELVKDPDLHVACLSEFTGLPITDSAMSFIDPSLKRV